MLVDSRTWDWKISSSSCCDGFHWNIFFILTMTWKEKKKIEFFSLCYYLYDKEIIWHLSLNRKYTIFEEKFHQPSHQQVSQCEIHLFFYAKASEFFPLTFFFHVVTFKNIKIIWEDWDALKRQKNEIFSPLLFCFWCSFLFTWHHGKLMKVRDCFLSDSSEEFFFFHLNFHAVPEIISLFFPSAPFWSL